MWFFPSRSRISAFFLSRICNFVEYAGCRTNWAAVDFVFSSVIHYNFFVIFLRVGRFEGEGVGTVFVYFDSFNVCHFYGLVFSFFFKNCFQRNLIVLSNKKNSSSVISLTLYGIFFFFFGSTSDRNIAHERI